MLRVAFVRLTDDNPVLLRLDGPLADAPRIVEAEFSEGATEVVEVRPAKFGLAQNVPNPFNPTTTIRYSIARD